MSIEELIISVLMRHPRAKGARPPFQCLGCDWEGDQHYAHVASVLIAELRLTEVSAAILSADSILSILHYRGIIDSNLNRADIQSACDKLARLRGWDGPR